MWGVASRPRAYVAQPWGRSWGTVGLSMGVGEGEMMYLGVLVYDVTATSCGGGGLKVNSTVSFTGGFYLRVLFVDHNK